MDVRTATLLRAVDMSLPPAELVSDSVKRLSRAHMFHFHSLASEIACLPRDAPSTWIFAALSGGVPAEKVRKGT
jgi:hypothetical protein